MTTNDASPADQRMRMRRRMRERRRELDAPARLAAAQGLRHHLDELPAFAGATRVAGYWAVGGELPLNLVLASLASRGQGYCLPCVDAGHGMRFVAWQAGDAVAANRFGIPEPVDGEAIDARQLDVVLLPLVAFDRRGNRLGSGAGYYDRAFAFLAGHARPARPLLVGVGYAFQECAALDAADWDIPLDLVATEHGLIDCRHQDPA